MEACADCLALHGKLSAAEPHAALKLLDSRKHRSMGNAVGKIEHYQCTNCATQLLRDMDRKDDGASWEISK